MKRRVTILGATGSVGKSTLDLVEAHPDRFEVAVLAAGSNVEGLARAALRTRASKAVIGDAALVPQLRERLAGSEISVDGGAEALEEAAADSADWVMAAIVGSAGLRPVMAAIRAGRTVALANKEALVTAGHLMTSEARHSRATILPVDSEHNAIFQCLAGQDCDRVSRLILTASGGPFREASSEAMRAATPEQAVAHPNWSMGAKISVDSATMMNKGLELIEAHYLFALPSNRIDILVHPQSVVHSLVEFADGSVLAQLGSPDMRIPIAHALAWPERMTTPAERLDLAAVARLDFLAPDPERFPALRLAREALESGPVAAILLNAANEFAVAAFLERKIGFLEIAALVAEVVERVSAPVPQSVSDVVEIDRLGRESAAMLLTEMAS